MRPRLYVMVGPSSVGKSTLASGLAPLVSAEHVELDLLPRGQPTPYEQSLHIADRLLGRGRSAILDGTFVLERMRMAASEIALRHNAKVVFIEVRTPESVAIARAYAKGPGYLVGYHTQVKYGDPISAAEIASTLVLPGDWTGLHLTLNGVFVSLLFL